MKKNIAWLLFAVFAIFSFSLGVSAAAPSTIKTGSKATISTQYLKSAGAPNVSLLKASDGTQMFCENQGKLFPENQTVTLTSTPVDKGFVYILLNKPSTGDSNRNYYLQQLAVWWHYDYLNGTSNVSSSFKTYCTNNRNSNTDCKYVYDLVTKARTYTQSRGSIVLSGVVTFTKVGTNFESSKITVTSQNLDTFSGPTLSGAPSGTTIINKSISNGTGTFQIRIPVSSIGEGKTVEFYVKASGTYATYAAYEYRPANTSSQQYTLLNILYKTTTSIPVEKKITINRPVEPKNSIVIKKVNQNGTNLIGATLTLWNGNCVNSTCSGSKYDSWSTTLYNPRTLNNVPKGTYTLEETGVPSGYRKAEKQLVVVDSDSGSWSYTVVNTPADKNSITIRKVNQNGTNLIGATLTLWNGDCMNSTCSGSKYDSWSTTLYNPRTLNNVPKGTYTLEETGVPAGYKKADKQLVVVDSENGSWSYTMVNTPADKNLITIKKVNEKGTNLIGATLTLWSGDCMNSTCSGSSYASWSTTLYNPKTLENVPKGTYTLEETGVPAGYKKADKQLVVVDSENGSWSYTMVNTPKDKNSLTIRKTTEDGNTLLDGASLSLYRGSCVYSECLESNLIGTWNTADSNPKTFTDLATDNYTLVENSAPSGYKKTNKVLIPVERDDVNYSYTLKNHPVDQIRISKTDITGTKEVPGATLVLKDLNGNVIESWVSTNSPKYLTLEAGEYCLTETLAPAGYKLSTETICFKIDDQGKIYQKNIAGAYVLVDYIKMVNEVRETVNISKLDSKTNAFVIGAKLVIKDLNGNVVATWTTTNQTHYLTLDPGEYYIDEIVTPDGYKTNNSVIYFQLLEDGTLMVKDQNGNYSKANGIIVYNTPEEEVIPVPITGLSSTLTYFAGTLVLISGAWILLKNGAIRI